MCAGIPYQPTNQPSNSDTLPTNQPTQQHTSPPTIYKKVEDGLRALGELSKKRPRPGRQGAAAGVPLLVQVVRGVAAKLFGREIQFHSSVSFIHQRISPFFIRGLVGLSVEFLLCTRHFCGGVRGGGARRHGDVKEGDDRESSRCKVSSTLSCSFAKKVCPRFGVPCPAAAGVEQLQIMLSGEPGWERHSESKV